MMPNEPEQLNQPVNAPPRRSRWLKWFVVCCAVLALVIAAFVWLYVSGAKNRFSALLAAMEQADPGRVRLPDLDASRPNPPPGANPVQTVRAALKLLPQGWERGLDIQSDDDGGTEPLDVILRRLPPNQLPDPDTIVALEKRLDALAPAVAALVPIGSMGEGRITDERDYSDLSDSKSLEALSELRLAGRLLALAVNRQLNSAAPHQTLLLALAQLGCGRAIGEEHGFIPMLTRCALCGVACNSIEHILAKSELTDDALSQLQASLARERSKNLWLIALRGERALLVAMIEATYAGTWPPGVQNEGVFARFGTGFAAMQQLEVLQICHELTESARTGDLATQIRVMDEISKRADGIANSPSLIRMKSLFVAQSIPSYTKVLEALLRNQAQLAAAEAIIAAERYRLRHGRWPTAMAELDSFWADRPGIEPFSGQTLLLRRTQDGLVIYSTGPDGKDNGGQIRSDPDNPYGGMTLDLGYRLWDVTERRKPLPAPAEGGRPAP